MRRRTVLAASTTLAAAPLAALAGCVDDDSEDDAAGNGSPDDTDTPTEPVGSTHDRAPDEYDTCSRMVVPLSSFPNPAQEEIRIALEEGAYDTDGEPYLPNLIDVESSYVDAEGTTYRVRVERGETTRIELEAETPTRGERSFAVENGTNEPISGSVTVERVGGEVVLSETLELDANGRVSAGAFERVFGDYLVTVDTESFTDTLRFDERESAMPLEGVVVDADGAEVVPLPRAVMELVSCLDVWDTRS